MTNPFCFQKFRKLMFFRLLLFIIHVLYGSSPNLSSNFSAGNGLFRLHQISSENAFFSLRQVSQFVSVSKGTKKVMFVDTLALVCIFSFLQCCFNTHVASFGSTTYTDMEKYVFIEILGRKILVSSS